MLNQASVEMQLAELQRKNKGNGEAILEEELLLKLSGRLEKQEKRHK